MIGRLSAICWLLSLLLLPSASITAQDVEKEDHVYKPLILKLNEEGTHYIRFITWHQIRMTSNNLENDQAKFQLTPSIRRSRIMAYAQISPRFLILTHFGVNNLTPQNLTSLGSNGNSAQLFLHGAFGEIKVNDKLYLGGGLHYWKGLTRRASQSTLNLMTMDQTKPYTHWHSLGISDQFARHLGFYAKGKIGKLDYRVAINSPLRNNLNEGADYGLKNSGLVYNGVSQPDVNGQSTGNMIIEGYFRHNFWDQESTKLPYQVGTYLGKKKVLALGAGFFSHPNGMYKTETRTHSHINHFAIDAYMDTPVPGGSFNAYAAFMKFDYGENYVSRWAGTGNS